MAEVRWTLQAAEDLEAITAFIAADSPYYASLFAMDVLSAVERLSVFPGAGRVVPEIDDAAIREILFRDYRIIYRLEGDSVAILTVHHGARLLGPANFT